VNFDGPKRSPASRCDVPPPVWTLRLPPSAIRWKTNDHSEYRELIALPEPVSNIAHHMPDHGNSRKTAPVLLPEILNVLILPASC
jgi:hypothetical protein